METAQCVDYYTRLFRVPGGTWVLRDIQAIALHETYQMRGLLGAIKVGGGKTLYSLLAPRLLGAMRPLLLLPAALIEKTKREMGALMKHWDIPRNVQMQSYEMLGRDGASRFLEIVKPDLIIADEAHKLKNPRAGVTRRVARFMHEHPDTPFVAISGTLISDCLEDFAHLAHWSLRANAPLPIDKGELMEWSECLGRQTNPLRTVDPGPLVTLAHPDDRAMDATETARRGFARRMRETRGVIVSQDEHVNCSLLIQCHTITVNGVTERNFQTLRHTWETPDGWALSQAVDIWRHANELALGFHYVWDPRPPWEWLEVRRQWAKFVRKVLSSSHSLDTEFQVAKACAEGHLDPQFYHPWAAIRDTFQANAKAIWHDDTALQWCQSWANRNKSGIIWVRHSFFGHELSRRTGIPYFGEQGVDANGMPIEKADPRHCVIASFAANSTGRNLQAWNKNLLTSPPAGAPQWEQFLGRTHRDGQQADSVTVDVMLGCRENWNALDRALETTGTNASTMGQVGAKLLLADLVRPSESEVESWGRSSVRWARSSGRATDEDT